MVEDIYSGEKEVLKKAKELLVNNIENNQLGEAYQELTGHFEQLLNNMIVMTNISDRFQEKYKLANDQLKGYTEQVTEANRRLEKDNRSLKSNLVELNKKKGIEELLDFEKFEKKYSSKEVCFEFFDRLKWNGNYTCKKCGNSKSCAGNSYLARRCTKCRYDESVTAYTIFHKCKFSITKAMYMMLLIHYKKCEISSYELSRVMDLRQKTCWSFKQKVKNAFDQLSAEDQNNPELWVRLITNP
jgi:two-component system, sensor histidine kinase LadS